MQMRVVDQQARAQSGRGTVLVVDDDPALVAFVQEALRAEGYAALGADDRLALEMAHQHHPDLILLDLVMPRLDGWEVSWRLRSDPATADIPIVAFSAHPTLRDSAPLPHMDACLPKPFALEDLYAAVERWVRRRQG